MSKKTARSLDVCCLTEVNRKLSRLMNKSANKIAEELNVVNLIRNHRNVRYNTAKNKYSAKTKFLVDHS